MGTINKKVFGQLSNGIKVHQFTLKNNSGLEVRCIEYGAIITHLFTPNRDGNSDDIVLGYDRLEDYIKGGMYLGAVVGRFGNRIEHGSFKLDDKTYNIPQNESANSLHSGPNGFDKKLWKGLESQESLEPAVTFKMVSPDGDNGFPGELNAEVTYQLKDDNSLHIRYTATTTKTTVVNLTQHSYFNLNGLNSDILDHEIKIDADNIVAVDQASIPLPEMLSVDKTPFDFRERASIGERINMEHAQLNLGSGFDHTFVLNQNLNAAISVYDQFSGRTMEVITTEPGVQFYSGNHLNNSIKGKNGIDYNSRMGFCLETQHFPNSPNRPDFPTSRLDPGDTYKSETVYKFGIK